jgi:hypothetical protein
MQRSRHDSSCPITLAGDGDFLLGALRGVVHEALDDAQGRIIIADKDSRCVERADEGGRSVASASSTRALESELPTPLDLVAAAVRGLQGARRNSFPLPPTSRVLVIEEADTARLRCPFTLPLADSNKTSEGRGGTSIVLAAGSEQAVRELLLGTSRGGQERSGVGLQGASRALDDATKGLTGVYIARPIALSLYLLFFSSRPFDSVLRSKAAL